jgi:sugar lactone lactonase YvrE
MVEGGPDVLAAFHFLNGYNMLRDVAVVGMLGASNLIRLVALADGATTTLAGADGAGAFRNGPFAAAAFAGPAGVAVATAGAPLLFVADFSNNMVRALNLSAGVVSTWAGAGGAGWVDGPPLDARFNAPFGLHLLGGSAVNALAVTDSAGHRLRLVVQSPAPAVVTLAGSGFASFANGVGTSASFNSPAGVAAAGASGPLYVAELGGNRIRAVTLAGVVTTLAGTGTTGGSDTAAASATFSGPTFLAVAPGGSTLFVADTSNNQLRAIDLAALAVTTVAGTQAGSGYVNGLSPRFTGPSGLAALGGAAHEVGDHVAQVRLARAHGREAAVERHERDAEQINQRWSLIEKEKSKHHCGDRK